MDLYLNTLADLSKSKKIDRDNDVLFAPKVSYKGHSYTLLGITPLSKIERVAQFFRLIGKLAVGVSLVPLFFQTYRDWVKKTFRIVASAHAPIYLWQWSSTALSKIKISIMPGFTSKDSMNKFLDQEILKRKNIFFSLQERLKKDKPAFYEKMISSPLFGHIEEISGNFGLWMGGTALAASLLSNRHNIKNLFVCETMEAFVEQYNRFCSSDDLDRCVFIVPTIGSGWPSRVTKDGVEPPNFPQHQFSVCVEKTAEGIKVALLDSSPAKDSIKSNQVRGKTLWAGREGRSLQDQFNHNELVARAILQGSSSSKKTELYIPSVKREFAGGCAIFALHDAISFLRRKNFFDVIQTKPVYSIATSSDADISLHTITELPPENMMPTQSLSSIQEYQKRSSRIEEEFPGKKNKKTLQSSLMSSKWQQADSKKINHHISLKHLKYIDSILDTLSSVLEGKMSENDFFALQKKCLVTSAKARPPM